MKKSACIAALMLGCVSHTSTPPSRLPPPRVGFPVYEGTVAIDPPSRSLRARWRITFVQGPGTTDSVTFLLNDALAISRVGGHDVLGHVERDPEDGRKRVTVRFVRRTGGDAATEVELEYAGVLNLPEDSINSVDLRWVELGLDSFWHPVFDDFAQSITARVRLELPADWKAVASGTVTGEDTLVLTNEVPLIDIAFTAAPTLRAAGADRATVYHAGADSGVVAAVLETAASCAHYLDTRYGARAPLPPVKIVLAQRGGPGYARKNYVVINYATDTSALPLKRFMCHELAHYWSLGAISSGPENWLNEAFAEFVSARYVRAMMGDSAYGAIVAQWREVGQGQPAVWTPELTRRPSARTAYRKAPYLLHSLEERVGTPMMDSILVGFMVEPVRTTPLVLEMIGRVAGAETAAWFREQLAK